MTAELTTGKPALLYEYLDEVEGFKGWLVIDDLVHRLCAGGMRVQKGLDSGQLASMARNMTLKMRLSGIRADGAKCGIDYDPAAQGKKAAMARFIKAIRPYIESRYSMGPDLNVEMGELEQIAAGLGIPSVKMAVARAMDWDMKYFLERYALLNQEVNGSTLGRLRAGTGVAAAVLKTLDYLDIPRQQATVAVQGFGTLARAAIAGLAAAGVRVTALADAEKSVIPAKNAGIDLTNLLKTKGPLLPDTGYGAAAAIKAKDAIFACACDVLVPAAVEQAISSGIAAGLKVRAVVPGANLAVSGAVAEILAGRGIIVLPDFLAGCGGSLSMAGLFSPARPPAPAAVLAYVNDRMSELVEKVLRRSTREQVSPTVAALRFCAEAPLLPAARPY